MLNLSNPDHQQLLLKSGVPQSKIDIMHEKQKRGEKLSNWIKVGNKIIRMPESPEEVEERNKIHKQTIQLQKERREQKIENDFNLNEFSEMSEVKKAKTQFFKKIENSILVKTSCWIWIGNPEDFIKIRKEAYETFKKKLDEDSELLHKCDNTKCINPNHLYTTQG